MSNLDNFIKTLSNLKEYASDSSYNCKGELFAERKGFLVENISCGRTYYVKFIVNFMSETVMIEVSPGITCAPCYERAFDAYVSPINNDCMIFKLLRSETGRVYVYCDQRITCGPVSAEEFSLLESNMITHLMCHMENLERVTHGEPPAAPRSVKEVKAEIGRINREHERRQQTAQLEEEEMNSARIDIGLREKPFGETETEHGPVGRAKADREDYTRRIDQLFAALRARANPDGAFSHGREGEEEASGTSGACGEAEEDNVIVLPGQSSLFGKEDSVSAGPDGGGKAKPEERNEHPAN